MSKPSTITADGSLAARRGAGRGGALELLDLDTPAVAAAVAERHAQARACELSGALLRPLHERDPTGAQVVVQQRGLLALEAREAVEVEVRDRHCAVRGSGGRC